MERCCHVKALFAMKRDPVFEGLGMLENFWNLAHTSERVKIDIRYGFQDCVWQNGSIVPPTKFQRSSPRSMFHRNVWKICEAHATSQEWKKNFSWCHDLTHQDVSYFEFNFQFWIFGHLQGSYFNELLENSPDQLQFWALKSKVVLFVNSRRTV